MLARSSWTKDCPVAAAHLRYLTVSFRGFDGRAGGTSDPCIISWPTGRKACGEIRTQYHYAIDLAPTILDALNVDPPATIKGYTQSALDGVSHPLLDRHRGRSLDELDDRPLWSRLRLSLNQVAWRTPAVEPRRLA